MDTGADVKVLGRRPVTMTQTGDGAHLKGFIAGPFDVKAEQSIYQVDPSVALLKDSMLLGMDFLRDHKLHMDAGSLCFFLVFWGGGGETTCMTRGRISDPWKAEVRIR